MASVDIHSVSKSFNKHSVLQDIDICVKDGEFVALVGPSGCGKSTLLRMIAGLEAVTSGEILIDGKTVNDLPPKDRDIAMVFQNYALYPHMTVRDNMGFSLRLRKADPGSIEERVHAASDILGMRRYLAYFPRQLSGGQRQRVAMGRAIVRDPKVFLFDEPLSNLDAKLRVNMRIEIKGLHQRLRTTSIYVTHDQVEAMTMADRIIVLNEGRIAQIGRPLELYGKPANLAVAGFIGSPAMNFIPGVLRRAATRAEVAVRPDLALPVNERVALASGRKVIYGIRPEHLRLNASEGIPCVIDAVEPTGANTYIYARSGELTVCAMFPSQQAFTPGDRIFLQPAPEHIHLFDADHGNVIDHEGR